MSAIDDLATALQEYPNDNVDIEIVDFERGSDGHINAGEVWSFRVRISNTGLVDMSNVRLHLNDSQWTSLTQSDILGNPFGFTDSTLTTAPLNVPAGASVTTRKFYMRADQATGSQGTENEDLFEVHLAEWDASLSSLLRTQARHDGDAQDTYTRHIHP